jgi:hypothetical protein
MLTATLEENIAAFHRVFVTSEGSSGRAQESSLLFDGNGKWEARHFLSGNWTWRGPLNKYRNATGMVVTSRRENPSAYSDEVFPHMHEKRHCLSLETQNDALYTIDGGQFRAQNFSVEPEIVSGD